MPNLTGPGVSDRDEVNNTDVEQFYQGNNRLDSDTRAYELRLWPPPCQQAYCLDHFLMECQIYHEQENGRYKELVAHYREMFLERQDKKKPSNIPNPAPVRRQPTRRAKENHSILEMTPPPTPPESKQPPGPKRPLNAPFKPPRLEKAFMKSQEGVISQNLTEFYEKLELDKGWEEYRPPLENKIQEAAGQLRDEIENGRGAHTNCIFGGLLRIECRYCGFIDTVQDDDGVTPRKLAAPAAMHAINPLVTSGDTKEPGFTFRGINFTIDVCGEKAMIVLLKLKGALDLCAGLFEEEVVPGSPASLSAYLSNTMLETGVSSAIGTKRQTGQIGSDKGQKRRKTILE
ncbi:hypothetical protein F5Y10DRAFT_268097 [Nemania abortiva]|nr:hypothetical protein F5Y10DRAFT_268097 [Nemania abortiva]